MPCYSPLSGYRSMELNPSGKRSITFNSKQAYDDNMITIACGNCIGCRLERSRQWAVRCMHEAELHEENCWITLTYSPENLPENGSLNRKHFQDFMKRLRHHYSDKKILVYYCGEYGEKGDRPHFHACLFGMDFEDKVHWKTRNGYKYYVSEILNRIWSKGHCAVGDLTFETAAYTARYVTKKVTGKNAEKHYSRVDMSTGEIIELTPEFNGMSLKPAIGLNWLKKYSSDVYPDDFVISRGLKVRPPKYYDRKFDLENPEMLDDLKQRRNFKSKKNWKENTRERLTVKKIIKIAKLKMLQRSFENEE